MTTQPVPEVRALSLRRVSDIMTFLRWTFVDAQAIRQTRKQMGDHAFRRFAVWPVSIMLWLPFAIPMITVTLGLYPNSGRVPPIMLLIALLAGWGTTVWLGLRGKTPFDSEREVGATESVFGYLFGVTVGGSYLGALAVNGEIWFGEAGTVLLLLAFAMTVGAAFRAVDLSALGSGFVIAAMIALVVIYATAYGFGFVMAFAFVFIFAFLASFLISLAAGPLIRAINKQQSGPGTPLGTTMVILLGIAYVIMIVVLASGWWLPISAF